MDRTCEKIFLEIKKDTRMRSDLNEETTVHILSRSIFGVIMSTIFEPEKFKSKEEVAEELTRLVMGYVALPPTA